MSDLPAQNRDANENRDEILTAIYSMQNITTSVLLTTVATFAANVTSIMIVPELSTDNVRISHTGDASASTGHLPVTGICIPVNKAIADTIELYAAAASDVTLFVYGPRT